MKTTFEEATERSGCFTAVSGRAMESYLSDFRDGTELTRPEMYGYYLAKEYIFWYAENCAAREGDYWNARRFYKKRDKAHTMRHLMEFNIF